MIDARFFIKRQTDQITYQNVINYIQNILPQIKLSHPNARFLFWQIQNVNKDFMDCLCSELTLRGFQEVYYKYDWTKVKVGEKAQPTFSSYFCHIKW